MGETRVDLHHLLEDLRDAYPGALEETILTEIVANSLDSGARLIRLRCDPSSSKFLAVDDGSGMQRRDLARYHDIAATTKTRGQGIGFAGVGIKLGLLLCDFVLTETRRGKTHIATRWHLASRHKAPWHWEKVPPGFVEARGTAVQLKLSNALSPLLDPGFIEGALRRHFPALLDHEFGPLLSTFYPHGVRLEVNDRVLAPEAVPAADRAPVEVRLARKRKPSAIGYLVREDSPLPEERRGLAISTLGKTIKRGWDWLGVTPAAPDRVGGLIEVPPLAECLTLNKADFIRTGTRGATYLAYRKAIQQAVVEQFTIWGDARDGVAETRRRAARPVERDLERVLIDLADEFPLLATLVERRDGGQRRLPIGRDAANGQALIAASVMGRATEEIATAESRPGLGAAGEPWPDAGAARPDIGAAADTGLPGPEAPAAVAEPPPEPAPVPADSTEPAPLALPGTGGPRRPARYGLEIQFDTREGDPELARLVESTVWVNDAHPAFRRAVASRSEGYHIALSVAMALAPLAVEPHHERRFVTSFLEHWGASVATPPRKRR